MRKVILVTSMPDDCYHVVAEIHCSGSSCDQIHVLEYDEKSIGDRHRAYHILQEQLEELGID